jgi:quercetin dioxygenase-like cupin family protein
MADHTEIIRKNLLTADLNEKRVTKVEVREITLQPGQKAGKHLHPCPVTGYVSKGAVSFQIDGEDQIIIPAGGAFFEPAGKTILKFDNNSNTEPLTFIAFYLLDGDQELIKML